VEEFWTILELAELAAETLAASQPAESARGQGLARGQGSAGGEGSVRGEGSAGGEGSGLARAARATQTRANGRVRDVPNERLVRWYVTVGLVDPPLSRRGRVARYGRRHLLQLVAVKRRQAEGRSLAEIQAELAGATDEALAAVARVPGTKPALQPAPAVLPAAPARFWSRSAAQRDPAAAEEPGERDLAPEEPGERGLAMEEPGERGLAAGAGAGAGRALSAARGDPADRGRSRLVHGVSLASGVTLLLEGAAREPGPDDVTAILNAARALLAELASRRLREPGPEHPADVPGSAPEVGQKTEGSQT
jgi:DNA-binding transcriptional MerR regulator